MFRVLTGTTARGARNGRARAPRTVQSHPAREHRDLLDASPESRRSGPDHRRVEVLLFGLVVLHCSSGSPVGNSFPYARSPSCADRSAAGPLFSIGCSPLSRSDALRPSCCKLTRFATLGQFLARDYKNLPMRKCLRQAEVGGFEQRPAGGAGLGNPQATAASVDLHCHRAQRL